MAQDQEENRQSPINFNGGHLLDSSGSDSSSEEGEYDDDTFSLESAGDSKDTNNSKRVPLTDSMIHNAEGGGEGDVLTVTTEGTSLAMGSGSSGSGSSSDGDAVAVIMLEAAETASWWWWLSSWLWWRRLRWW